MTCELCEGLVVILDDVGRLSLSYMGSDPPMQAVDMKHSAEVDYSALDTEYRELAGQIQAVGAPTDTTTPEDQLIITAHVSMVGNHSWHSVSSCAPESVSELLCVSK